MYPYKKLILKKVEKGIIVTNYFQRIILVIIDQDESKSFGKTWLQNKKEIEVIEEVYIAIERYTQIVEYSILALCAVTLYC